VEPLQMGVDYAARVQQLGLLLQDKSVLQHLQRMRRKGVAFLAQSDYPVKDPRCFSQLRTWGGGGEQVAGRLQGASRRCWGCRAGACSGGSGSGSSSGGSTSRTWGLLRRRLLLLTWRSSRWRVRCMCCWRCGCWSRVITPGLVHDARVAVFSVTWQDGGCC